MAKGREEMSEVLQLTEVALRVVEMTETMHDVTVKFERVDWVLTRGEDDAMEFETVGVGMPGAKYATTGEFFSLRLPEADGIEVGGHYQLRLHVVPNVTPDDEL